MDDNLNYSKPKEVNYWKKMDPLKKIEKILIQKKLINEKKTKMNLIINVKKI